MLNTFRHSYVLKPLLRFDTLVLSDATLCDVYVLYLPLCKICFDTLTFGKPLRFDTLTLSVATLCDGYVVLCYTCCRSILYRVRGASVFLLVLHKH